ncbi:MAG: hypothetical protein N2746_04100 [Deltaproteobacteria bacterium]|nr:hypothetical protein [Deltaproteobacteria bacterium]
MNLKKAITFILLLHLFTCEIREYKNNYYIYVNDETNSSEDINDTNVLVDVSSSKKYSCMKYNLSFSTDNDEGDIYIPTDTGTQFYPIILLQGSDLSKDNYNKISELICNNGFIVVTFDHYKESFSGKHLYAEQNATNKVYYKLLEISNLKDSILFGRMKKDKFILLGHSYGAACGLFMIGNECKWPFCSETYERPYQLSGGIFYGISLKSPFGEKYYQIKNDNIPILLIAGDNDGVIKYEHAEKTLASIQSQPKFLVKLKNANHYAINDENPPKGADADKNIQQLNQETGLEIISSLTTSFIIEYVIKEINTHGHFEKTVNKFIEYIELKKDFY